jgi:hypothetical protein
MPPIPEPSSRPIKHAARLYESRHPVVLAGDFNAVCADKDIDRPRSWLNDANADRRAHAGPGDAAPVRPRSRHESLVHALMARTSGQGHHPCRQ